MGRTTRPRLPEWCDFADSLEELIKGANMTNMELAQLLGRGYDRQRAGAILGAREPCPEGALILLYKKSAQAKYQDLRDSDHLHLLTRLWARAAESEPGPTLKTEMIRAGTPWTQEGESPAAEPNDSLARPRAVVLLPIVAAVLVALAIATASVLPTRSTDAAITGSQFSHSFQADYGGPVHLTVVPLSGNAGEDHSVELQWGAWTRRVSLPSLQGDGITLVFTKTDSGTSVPLEIEVSPQAELAVGAGNVKDGIDVNAGWTRSSDGEEGPGGTQ